MGVGVRRICKITSLASSTHTGSWQASEMILNGGANPDAADFDGMTVSFMVLIHLSGYCY